MGLTPDISPKSNNWSASLVRLVTTWIRLPYTLIRVALFHLKWKRRLERHYGIFMKWNMTWVKWCGNFGARYILWKLAKLKKFPYLYEIEGMMWKRHCWVTKFMAWQCFCGCLYSLYWCGESFLRKLANFKSFPVY